MKKLLGITGSLLILLSSCNNLPASPEDSPKNMNETAAADSSTFQKTTPDWSKQATIYEVNIRQYTPEGTINAFIPHLDRLQKLGVKILWLMPVQPIGVEKRKGELGSYYSIRNYTAINPEFGTLEDFEKLVEEAHARGFKVILDWVANHTSFDHSWVYEHTNWYNRDSAGNIVAPVEDWSDVADLNYEAPGMPEAMTQAMLWWVKKTDIDGFRCDMAMMVPLEFWQETRRKLEQEKPVFMLAEAEGPEFHQGAFDMTYSWEMHHLMNDIAKNEKTVSVLEDYRAKQDSVYDEEDYRMTFTTNHDENSWQGTVFERMGDNHLNFFVLCATFDQAMPLVYSGQEAGLKHRLEFFKKDSIDFRDTTFNEFYQKIIALKSSHPALINGTGQGSFKPMFVDDQHRIYAYRRVKGPRETVVILNFGDAHTITGLELEGEYENVMTGKTEMLEAGQSFAMEANDFLLLQK